MLNTVSNFLPNITWTHVSIASGLGAAISIHLFRTYSDCAMNLHNKFHQPCGQRDICNECKEFNPLINSLVLTTIATHSVCFASTAYGIGSWAIS